MAQSAHEDEDPADAAAESSRDVAKAIYEEGETEVRVSTEVNIAVRAAMKGNEETVQVARNAADAALRAAQEAAARAVEDAKSSDPSAW